jgi:hypothetical protein
LRVPENHPLALALALRRPETARAAVEALSEMGGQVALDGFVELLLAPASVPAEAAVAAVDAVSGINDPLAIDALCEATLSPHVTVRIAAIEALGRLDASEASPCVLQRLRFDRSWMVRAAAVGFLAALPDPVRWEVLAACDDPHWRVRHSLLQSLLSFGQAGEGRDETFRRLEQIAPARRVIGLRNHLHWKWKTGQTPESMPEVAPPPRDLAIWDWDPEVLVRELTQLEEGGRQRLLSVTPWLLGHDDLRVRRFALDTLRRYGEPKQLAAAVSLLFEPRHEAADSARDLLERLDLDRRAEVVAYIQSDPEAAPEQRSWANGVPADIPAHRGNEVDRPWRQRLCAAEEAVSRGNPSGQEEMRTLGSDPHPYVRAASMTGDRARQLVEMPCLETSWHVLTRAAQLCRVPLWQLEPEAVCTTPRPPQTAWRFRAFSAPPPPFARPLGPSRLLVSPIGISGHYGLSPEGFARAREAGINLMFWEPRYHLMTRFFTGISPAERRDIHLVAGTFAAEGPRIRKEAERTLKALRIERIEFFFLFWVQSWARITDDVRATLENLRRDGSIGNFSLSTHVRPLAMEAIREGWNPIMVRHSAAHRGAEIEVLPLAARHDTSVITFNNTCYGRLLRPNASGRTLRAEDLYRYSLAQAGVTACLSAPRNLQELEAALAVAADPGLPADVERDLLSAGEGVLEEDRNFYRNVRSV